MSLGADQAIRQQTADWPEVVLSPMGFLGDAWRATL